jgi:S-methylmethionine-dependent homocysteine/selenocysteine methylase
MKYRNNLPQLQGKNMTTQGGMETWLQYVDGFELEHFCFFDLLNNPKAVTALTDFHEKIIEAVLPYRFGVLLEGLHYRASRDWGELLGYSKEGLAEINARGIEYYQDMAKKYETDSSPMPIGGVIGPRGDAYDTGKTPEIAESEDYHSEQIEILKKAGADLITAATFSFEAEAIGIAQAAKAAEMPIVVSFTTSEDGRLLSGGSIGEAVQAVDEATGSYPAYYMINCSHPTEFEPVLEEAEWLDRIGGFMPNAVASEKLSLCSLGHLEDGDPEELGTQMGALAERYPHMTVWGGCCGTDSRHLGHIAKRVSEVRNKMSP